MQKIIVSVYPDNKTVEAYNYGPTVILIYSTKVQNSDTSIATNDAGYRFQRKITGEMNPLFFQYHQI